MSTDLGPHCGEAYCNFPHDGDGRLALPHFLNSSDVITQASIKQMNLFIIQLALVGLVLTLACGTQPTNTSQAPPIEDAQIPPMGEWPCSVEDKKGRITYPKLN